MKKTGNFKRLISQIFIFPKVAGSAGVVGDTMSQFLSNCYGRPRI